MKCAKGKLVAVFGKRSLKILEDLDPRLQEVLGKAIEIYDFSILSGFRLEEEQNNLFRNGLSQKRFPESKHNQWPSMAVDIAPYFKEAPHIRWEDEESFYFLAGIIRACSRICKTKIRWGGDWDSDDDLHDQSFMDLGHFELEG
jgi:peptidoglycan L-alanyl-D-glutamate endopeptidase CwlK